jgi:phosphoglycerate kinase
MQKELEYLAPMLTAPEQPFVVILGGAKVSDKIGVIKNLLPKVSALLIGGGMAYTFLKSQGIQIGRSLVEEEKLNLAAELVAEASRRRVKLVLPIDHITGDAEKKNSQTEENDIAPDRMGLDIGPKTVELFVEQIKKAKLVLWNGPVGLFEVAPYDEGSRTIANGLAESYPRVTSVIAGGDTVAAVSAAGVVEKITHLSTGGGATLEFLEGRELPGVKALEV